MGKNEKRETEIFCQGYGDFLVNRLKILDDCGLPADIFEHIADINKQVRQSVYIYPNKKEREKFVSQILKIRNDLFLQIEATEYYKKTGGKKQRNNC